MNGHGDVSWELIEHVLKDWRGSSTRLDEMTFLAGGIVNTTLSIRSHDGERAVLKISPHRVDYAQEHEAKSLNMLGELGVPVPKVLASHTATLEKPHSYLILQFVDGVTLRDAMHLKPVPNLEEVQRQLGEYTAMIHAATGPTYGRLDGEAFEAWPIFFTSLVGPVWDKAKEMACLPLKIRKTIGRVHERLDRLLSHADVPRLCHGDFWGANILVHGDADGRWAVSAILDPDLRYAHAEAEIAYMDLFKTITPTFKQAYQAHFRLCDQYHSVRKPIYQLYGLINQLQLHGAAYATPVITAAERLAAIV